MIFDCPVCKSGKIEFSVPFASHRPAIEPDKVPTALAVKLHLTGRPCSECHRQFLATLKTSHVEMQITEYSTKGGVI